MKGWPRLALVLALLLAPCLAPGEGPAGPAPHIHPAPFLWEIQGPRARHFLLGSVHLLPASAYPLPPALDTAWAATRVLVMEADPAELEAPVTQQRMLAAAQESRPGGLQARIGAPLYRRVKERAASLGVPEQLCDPFRAWFCAMTLELLPLQLAGFDPQLGLDRHFHQLAREAGHELAFLESAEFQLDLFAGMTDEQGRALLASTLDDSSWQSPEELLKIWRGGDFVALERVLEDLRRDYPALNEKMLAARNRAWAPVLARRLEGAMPVMVLVGMAHLAGPEGLVELLRQRGFRVEPVTQLAPAGAPAI